MTRGRTKLARRAIAGAVVVVVGAVVACGEDRPPCYAGEYQGCTCEPNTSGFTTGYAVCRPELGGYGPCVCDGKTPGLDAGQASATEASAPDAPADVGDAGKLALFATCAKDDDCGSGKCFLYGDGRMLCTSACTADDQATTCPSPSRGCNLQGVCKPP